MNGSLTVTMGNGRMDAMNENTNKNLKRTIKIVVLDDGDTWAGDANIFSVTVEGYEKLCNGEKFSQLDPADVVDIRNVYE